MREFKIYREDFSKKSGFENSLFNALFNDTSDAIFILAANDYTIINCNKKAQELFHVEDKFDLISISSFDLLNDKLIDTNKKNLVDVINSGHEYSQELAFKTFDENVFWGRLNKKMIRFDNEEYIILRINKVLDNNKASETLNTLIKNTSKVTGKKFLNSLTELLSNTFETKYAFIAETGNKRKENIKTIDFWFVNQHIENIVLPLKNGPFDNVLKGYFTLYPNNLQDLFPDYELLNEIKIQSLLGAPIFDKDGEVKGMFVLMDDRPMQDNHNARYILSIFASRADSEMDRVKHEEKLKNQTEQLLKVNKTKDKFLQIISHDLTNPSSNIMGYSELLKRNIEDYNKSKIKSIVNTVNESLIISYRLIQNLSDWSRSQRNAINLEKEKLEVRSIIDEITKQFVNDCSKKNIRINNTIDKKFKILVDRQLFKTIIKNLIHNSIKYSYINGEVIISNNNEKYSQILIKDNGVGIPASNIKKLINKKNYLSTPGTSNETGSGLGLILCNDFLRRHEGFIEIESKKGKGTTVICNFPGKKSNTINN